MMMIVIMTTTTMMASKMTAITTTTKATTTRSRSRRHSAALRHLACCLCLLHVLGHAHGTPTPTPAPAPQQQNPQNQQDSNDDNGSRGGVNEVPDNRNLHYENAISNASSIDGSAIIVPDIDSYSKVQLYALLIDIFEKLNVLAPKAASCYQLQRVEREVLNSAADSGDGGSGSSSSSNGDGGGGSGGSNNETSGSGSPSSSQPGDASSGSGGSRTLGVYLYFKETPLASSTPNSADNSPASASSSSASASAAAAAQSAGGATQDKSAAAAQGKADGGDQSSGAAKPSGHECVSNPDVVKALDAQPLVRDGGGGEDSNATHAPGAGGGAKDSDAGAGRHVNTNAEYHDNVRSSDYDDDDEFSGLSLTQVVVISTCSAIICIFFIVAFVLRVRNYLKRLREEQLQAQRPTFRSCSVRLRSVSHSNEQVRRDSQISKISHQSTLTNRGGTSGGPLTYSLTNGSTSRDNSTASSPRHDPADTKPLLFLTASAANSTTASATNITATTATGNAIAATENHPQHSPSASLSSSLQFIDEEPPRKSDRSASRATPCGADDSEARPLLACSDVSANSLRLSPASPLSGHAYISHASPPNGGPASPPPPPPTLDATNSAPSPAVSPPAATEEDAAGNGAETPGFHALSGDSRASSRGGGLNEGPASGRGPDSDRIYGRDRPRAASVDSFRTGQAPHLARDAYRRRSDVARSETHAGAERGRLSAIDDIIYDDDDDDDDDDDNNTNDTRGGRRSSNNNSSSSGVAAGSVPLGGLCGLTQSDSSLASQEGFPAGGGPSSYGYGTQAEYAPPDPGHVTGVEYMNGITGPYRAFPFLRPPRGGPFVLFNRRQHFHNDNNNGDGANTSSSNNNNTNNSNNNGSTNCGTSDNDAATAWPRGSRANDRPRTDSVGNGDLDVMMMMTTPSTTPGPGNDVAGNDVSAERGVGPIGEEFGGAAAAGDASAAKQQRIAAGIDYDDGRLGLEVAPRCSGNVVLAAVPNTTDRPGSANPDTPPEGSASKSPSGSPRVTAPSSSTSAAAPAAPGSGSGSRDSSDDAGVPLGVSDAPDRANVSGLASRGNRAMMTSDGGSDAMKPRGDRVATSSRHGSPRTSQTEDAPSSGDPAASDGDRGLHSTPPGCQDRLRGVIGSPASPAGPPPAGPLPSSSSSRTGDQNRQPPHPAPSRPPGQSHGAVLQSRDRNAGPGQTPPTRRGGPPRDKADQSPGRRSSAPSGVPEPEVVMKRLFSFDDTERTTFL